MPGRKAGTSVKSEDLTRSVSKPRVPRLDLNKVKGVSSNVKQSLTPKPIRPRPNAGNITPARSPQKITTISQPSSP